MGKTIEAIQNDGHIIARYRLADAIDAADWVTVHRLGEELQEIARRGLHHSSQKTAKSIAAFAMGTYAESEQR